MITITGNDDIDQATAEIAVALRNACGYTCSGQHHYDEAMSLRNRIMEGTRALDHQAQLDAVKDGVHPGPSARVVVTFQDRDKDLWMRVEGTDRYLCPGLPYMPSCTIEEVEAVHGPLQNFTYQEA